jgi:hypothetical protein
MFGVNYSDASAANVVRWLAMLEGAFLGNLSYL